MEATTAQLGLQNSLTLSISGELDQHRAKAIMEEIRYKIDCTMPKILILDLSKLTFADSSGIAVLLRVKRSMSQIEGNVKVIGVQPQPMRLFQVAGMDKLVEISPI